MIRFTQGNLLDAPVEALVNTVNEVGVMGKGIALMFREAFPESARVYQQACKRAEVKVGRVLATRDAALFGPRWILHFQTKKHWRDPSRLEWIRDGLEDLARVIHENGIHSIAVPPIKIAPSAIVSAHHTANARILPRSICLSASQIVTLLESRHTVLKKGISSTCAGYGGVRLFPM